MTNKAEKIIWIIMIALAILIVGVQLGIAHGHLLQLENAENRYGYTVTN